MRFAKWVFLVAGVSGILMIAPMYLEDRFFADFPPAINRPEFFYGFVGVTLAWQFMFLLIASDPVRFRRAILPAMLEKASFAVAVPLLYAAERVTAVWLGFAGMDVTWLVLFVIAFLSTPKADAGGVRAGNLDVVKRMYAAFASRQRDVILQLFAPDIEWVQNEGFPGGGRHVGAEAVLDGVFAKFRQEWDAWQAVVSEWIDAGDTVIALGEYRGTFKATGRSTTAAFAHVYRVRGGRIVRFEQFTDTAKVAEAMRFPDAKA